MNAKDLKGLALDLFSKRGTLELLWQEIAENFYVERADFTVRRTLGEDFAAHLSSSYPLLTRRELGEQIGTMLRPTQKAWFRPKPKDSTIQDNQSMRWMEWAEGVQRRAMYDPDAKFSRATKEADHDFATFGQFCMSVQLNRHRDALLYQTWHIKDVVWREDQDGNLDFKARKWRVSLIDLREKFPKATLDPKIHEGISKDPFREILVMHIVCSMDLFEGNFTGEGDYEPGERRKAYQDRGRAKNRVSIFWDCEHDRIIEAIPIWGKIYIIGRWQTVSGSQYAFSPATVAALPEARLLQAMTLTLLEAGEKAVNPPLVATADVVKSDMQIYPGGVTWIDAEYDERLGSALRAMNIDVKGLPIGLEMVQDSRGVLQQCFFLNKLRAFNPSSDPTMTAFQAGQIVQEYIRGALPLFEPMEMEYNAQMCDETFDIMYRNGGFGSPQDLPPELRNADVDFTFESPLHEAIEAQKGMKFLEFKQIIAEAIALDPAVAHIPDAKVILRDVAQGVRVPHKWLRTEMEVEEQETAVAQQAQQQEMLATMQQGADVVQTLGTARKDLAQAAAMQP